MQEKQEVIKTSDQLEEVELPEGSVVDTEGNVIEDPTSKELATIRLAYLIVSNEEEEDRALKYCLNNDNQSLTMEQYVSKQFSSLLRRYPEVREEYELNLAQERREKVKLAQENQIRARKARRKLKR